MKDLFQPEAEMRREAEIRKELKDIELKKWARDEVNGNIVHATAMRDALTEALKQAYLGGRPRV